MVMFFDTIPKLNLWKKKNENWNLIKSKSIGFVKDIAERIRISHRAGENICKRHMWSVLFRGQSCLTLCNPMGCSTPGLSVPHHLTKFAQIHVHCIDDEMKPSHPLMPSLLSALNLSQHQELFQWKSCLYQMTKIKEFQLQHQSFQ